jgi:predicted RNA-binding protein with PUA-like domain
MGKKYWLMKSEPDVFSIRDLQKEPNKTAQWDGVRNYQARNFLRDKMQVGDGVLFYHSRIDPSVAGTAKVVRVGYPDHTARDPRSKYFDPRSTPDNPVWFMVDIKFESEFPRPVPLAELRHVPGLEKMVLLKKGVRLSVQPVTAEEFRIIVALTKKKR